MTVIRDRRPAARVTRTSPRRAPARLPFFTLATLRLALQMGRELIVSTGMVQSPQCIGAFKNLSGPQPGRYRGLRLISRPASGSETNPRTGTHTAIRIVRIVSLTAAILLLFAAF